MLLQKRSQPTMKTVQKQIDATILSSLRKKFDLKYSNFMGYISFSLS